jgi:hypothetical protein
MVTNETVLFRCYNVPSKENKLISMRVKDAAITIISVSEKEVLQLIMLPITIPIKSMQ